MAKLTDNDKQAIIKEYAAGFSTRQIAQKFAVSATAISKILKSFKSLQNGDKSLQTGNKSVQKLTVKQNNAEIAKIIIDKAMASVQKDIDKAPVMDRIKIVERLTILYGNGESGKSALEKVCNELHDIIESP